MKDAIAFRMKTLSRVVLGLVVSGHGSKSGHCTGFYISYNDKLTLEWLENPWRSIGILLHQRAPVPDWTQKKKSNSIHDLIFFCFLHANVVLVAPLGSPN
jgi:hypothetical protein